MKLRSNLSPEVANEILEAIIKEETDIARTQKAIQAIENKKIFKESAPPVAMQKPVKGKTGREINEGIENSKYYHDMELFGALKMFLIAILSLDFVTFVFTKAYFIKKGLADKAALLMSMKYAIIITMIGLVLIIIWALVKAIEQGSEPAFMSANEIKIHDAKVEKEFTAQCNEYNQEVKKHEYVERLYEEDYKEKKKLKVDELNALTASLNSKKAYLNELYNSCNILDEHKNIYCVTKLRNFIVTNAASNLGEAYKMLWEHIDRRFIAQIAQQMIDDINAFRREVGAACGTLINYVEQQNNMTTKLINSIDTGFEQISSYNRANNELIKSTNNLIKTQMNDMKKSSDFLINTGLMADSKIDVVDINKALRRLNND